MSASLSFRAACARRLARHGLTGGHADLVTAAAATCGIHAQVMSAAEHSLARRVPGTTRQDVRRALWTDRTLTKTIGVRGTVHLYPTAELPFWMAALGAVPVPRRRPTPGVTLDPDERERIVAAISTALVEADLTLADLDVAVADTAGAWAAAPTLPAFGGAAPRWRQALAAAAYRGVLCYGPNRGRNVTYTSPRRWLPSYRHVDGPTALRELALRYLDSYGPATAAHLAQWLAADRAPIEALVGDLRDELDAVDLDGTPAWWPSRRPVVETAPDSLVLAPYFDAYVVGGHPRPLLFAGVAAERGLSGGSAGPVMTLLYDGIVAGVWHQARRGRRLAVTVEPFRRLGVRREQHLAAEVERVGTIMEAEPTLTIGPVTSRPHL